MQLPDNATVPFELIETTVRTYHKSKGAPGQWRLRKAPPNKEEEDATTTTTTTNDTTKNHDTLSGNVPQAKIELTLVFIYLHLDKLVDQVSNNLFGKMI